MPARAKAAQARSGHLAGCSCLAVRASAAPWCRARAPSARASAVLSRPARVLLITLGAPQDEVASEVPEEAPPLGRKSPDLSLYPNPRAAAREASVELPPHQPGGARREGPDAEGLSRPSAHGRDADRHGAPLCAAAGRVAALQATCLGALRSEAPC